MAERLSPQDRARLRAESCCDDVTICQWERWRRGVEGVRVLAATDARLCKAAQTLGIPIPERTEHTKQA
jgi:hypothetical protein